MYYFLQSQASVLPTKISGKIEILMKGNERCKNSDYQSAEQTLYENKTEKVKSFVRKNILKFSLLFKFKMCTKDIIK